MTAEYIALYVEMTSACNLRCRHCYNASGNKNVELDYCVLTRVIRQMAKDNVKSIALSGGEPTLYSHFWDVLDLCASLNIRTNIITNGTLWNKEMIEKIEIYDNVFIQVSLDGMEENHDYVRGKGTFQKVIVALDLLKNSKLKDRINIHCVINNRNYNEMEEIIRLCNSKGASSLSFNMYNKLGRACEKSEIQFSDNKSRIKTIDLINEIVDAHEDLQKTMRITGAPTTHFCPLLQNGLKMDLRIDSEGNVYPCQIFSGVQYSLGNIYSQTINEIIHSERTETFHDFIKIATEFNSECVKCAFKKSCGKGCPGERLADNSLNDVDDNCYQIKKEFFKAIMEA